MRVAFSSAHFNRETKIRSEWEREGLGRRRRRTVDVGGRLDDTGLGAAGRTSQHSFVFAFKLHRASGCLRLSL